MVVERVLIRIPPRGYLEVVYVTCGNHRNRARICCGDPTKIPRQDYKVELHTQVDEFDVPETGHGQLVHNLQLPSQMRMNCQKALRTT